MKKLSTYRLSDETRNMIKVLAYMSKKSEAGIIEMLATNFCTTFAKALIQNVNTPSQQT